ncbi:MAG: hypothetical protein V4808_01370 [Pseudomonadota bacterium]
MFGKASLIALLPILAALVGSAALNISLPLSTNMSHIERRHSKPHKV